MNFFNQALLFCLLPCTVLGAARSSSFTPETTASKGTRLMLSPESVNHLLTGLTKKPGTDPEFCALASQLITHVQKVLQVASLDDVLVEEVEGLKAHFIDTIRTASTSPEIMLALYQQLAEVPSELSAACTARAARLRQEGTTSSGAESSTLKAQSIIQKAQITILTTALKGIAPEHPALLSSQAIQDASSDIFSTPLASSAPVSPSSSVKWLKDLVGEFKECVYKK